jgi:hypothetical protein
MKNFRILIIASLVLLAIGLAAAAFFTLSGAERTGVSEKTATEMDDGDEAPPWPIIAIVLLVTGVSMIPFFKIFFPRQIRNGIDTTAKVLKVWDTGVTINDNPQVGLHLEIMPESRIPYQAEAKTVVSRLNVMKVQPGITAQVRYDSLKPERVQVLSLDINTKPVSDTEARLEELNTLRAKNLVTEEEYLKKREEILKRL